MLSAIILVPPGSRSTLHPFGPLLRTLAALVPLTVEGTVRDVTLMKVGANADVANIADEAGCRIIQAATFGEAVGSGVLGAKTGWICFLHAGTIPGPSFGEDVASALDEAGDPPRALVLRSGGALARYVPGLSTIVGVIAPKSRLSGAPCDSFAELVRRVRPIRSLASSVVFL